MPKAHLAHLDRLRVSCRNFIVAPRCLRRAPLLPASATNKVAAAMVLPSPASKPEECCPGGATFCGAVRLAALESATVLPCITNGKLMSDIAESKCKRDGIGVAELARAFASICRACGIPMRIEVER